MWTSGLPTWEPLASAYYATSGWYWVGMVRVETVRVGLIWRGSTTGRHERFGQGHGADLPKALHGRDPARPVVLLAHQPKAVAEAAEHGVDLVLSGHTHGGQLWPWTWMVKLDQPYVAGLHRLRDTAVYVSQGTGYWGPPMRIGTTAEITQVVLVPA